MAKPAWGIKRACQSCGAMFYDMRRTPITCPKCDAEFVPEPPSRSRRATSAPVTAKDAAPAKESESGKVESGADDLDIGGDPEAAGVDEVEVDDAEDEEDVMEDTSDIDEDDVDIGIEKPRAEEGS